MVSKFKSFADRVAAQTKKIRAMALRYTRDEDDAADLAQEVIIKAILHQDKFDQSTNLDAWLGTITRNLFISGYNRKKKIGHIADLSDDLYGEELLSTSVNPMGSEIMEAERIEIAFGQLDEQHREILELRRQGFKYEEIAELNQMPVGTVKNRIFIGRSELQIRLRSTSQPMNRMKTETTVTEPVEETNYDKAVKYLCRELLQRPNQTEGILVTADDLARRTGISRAMADFGLRAITEEGYLKREKRGISFVYWGNAEKLETLTGDLFRLLASRKSGASAKPEITFHTNRPDILSVDKKTGVGTMVAQPKKNPAPQPKVTVTTVSPVAEEEPKETFQELAERMDKKVEAFQFEKGHIQRVPAELIKELRETPSTLPEAIVEYPLTPEECFEKPAKETPKYNFGSAHFPISASTAPPPPTVYGFIEEGKVVWCDSKTSAVQQASQTAKVGEPITLIQKIGVIEVSPSVTLYQ